jgi:hypothetical protein
MIHFRKKHTNFLFISSVVSILIPAPVIVECMVDKDEKCLTIVIIFIKYVLYEYIFTLTHLSQFYSDSLSPVKLFSTGLYSPENN